MTPLAARRLRWTARAWLVVVVLGFAVLAWGVGLPVDAERDTLNPAIAGPGQLALLLLAVTGGVLALQWEAAGSACMAVAAAGLGLFSFAQSPPVVALAVGAMFAVPAVLTWLAWQPSRPPGVLALLAGVTVLLVAAETVAASRLHGHYLGPISAVSATPRLAVDKVEWVWSGALGPGGARVVARLGPGGGTARLLVDGPDGTRHASPPAPADRHRLVRLAVTGLRPDARYRYTVEVDGHPDRARGRGRFRTAPAGPASFTVAVASCARSGSNAAVFDAIRAAEPLLYVNTGDLHYRNIAVNSIGAFLAAYDQVLTAPAQAALYRDVPIDYIWDDHDYGPDNSGAGSPSRPAAQRAYRAAVPHPPLASPGAGAVYHAFTLGRVRFVVTDTRSERRPGQVLGAGQERWLLRELAAAHRYGLVVWVNPDPWIAEPEPAADHWGGYPEQRRRIADAIAAAGVGNLVMVSGDAHMVAVDDGSHSGYATGGGRGFPVLHAAALDRRGSVKGGPYSEGAHPGAGQFGLLRVTDRGGRISVDLEGLDRTGRVLVRHRFTAGS